jgi:hypothetical protein
MHEQVWMMDLSVVILMDWNKQQSVEPCVHVIKASEWDCKVE